MCSTVGGEGANHWRVGHADGGGRSAIVPPWFCDELGAGDGCRGHQLIYPSVGV